MSKLLSIKQLALRAAVLTALLGGAALLGGCKNETSSSSGASTSAAKEAAAPAASAPSPAVLSALSGDGAPPPAGAAAPPGGAPPSDPGAQAGGPPQVTIKVEDAGQGAKKLLRYRFQKGKTKSFTLSMSLAMNSTMNGQPGQPMPPVEFDFSGKSLNVEVDAEGTASRQTTFTNFSPRMPNLPPQIAAQMEQEMKGLEGVQITERISARGQVLGVEINQATVKSPQVQQMLTNLMEGMSNSFLPLPETPIGVGGRWESRTVVVAGGVTVTQIGRFKVTSIQGEKVSLELGIEQVADAKAAPSFPNAPGVTTELVSMDGKGTGQNVVDLGTLDCTGNVQIETKTVTRINSAASPGTPAVPGMPASPGTPAQSVTSTLLAKVGVKIKMTD